MKERRDVGISSTLYSDHSKPLPHDAGIEGELLIAIITLPKHYLKVAGRLKDEYFYDDTNRLVWGVIRACHEAYGNDWDLPLLVDMAGKKGVLDILGGAEYFTSMGIITSGAAFITQYCQVIIEKAMQREVIRASEEYAARAYSDTESPFDLLVDQQKTIESFAMAASSDEDCTVLREKTEQYMKDVESGKMVGVKTGFSGFDRLTGGMQKSDLIVIGTYPSNGKTATALNIMLNAGANGHKGKMYSLEQSTMQLYFRQLSILSGIRSNEIINDRLFHDEKVVGAKEMLSGYRNVFTDKVFHITDICNDIRQGVRRHGIEYAIVDYLQLVKYNNQKRNEGIGDIANSLKRLANEVEIPIVLLSQMARDDGPPKMNKLKESGDIENAADIVWLPWIPVNEPTELHEVTIGGKGSAPIHTSMDDDKLMIHKVPKGRNYGTTMWKSWFAPFLKIKEYNEYGFSDYYDKDETKTPF